MTYKINGCNKNIFLKRRKYVNTRICHRQRNNQTQQNNAEVK